MPLGADITLPELKYLDIDAYRHTTCWPKFSSEAFPANQCDSPDSIGETLPMLSYLYVAQHGYPISDSSVRDMLAAMPNLRTLVCSRSFPIPREQGFYELARNFSLRRFKFRFNDNFVPGDFGQVEHDMEIDFAALREHVLPLALRHEFPCSRLLQGKWIPPYQESIWGERARLDEIANGALKDFISCGVRVLVED